MVCYWLTWILTNINFIKLDEHGLYAFNGQNKGRALSKLEASFGKDVVTSRTLVLLVTP